MNLPLIDFVKPVIALNSAVPNSATPDYVSLKGAGRFSIVILAANATTVTGSVISLKQAKDVSGTGEKPLSFSTVYANVDTAATDTLVATAVTGDTFTTNATNSKNLMYWIEVRGAALDIANGFDCVRVSVGNATASTITVLYLLQTNSNPSLSTSAIID